MIWDSERLLSCSRNRQADQWRSRDCLLSPSWRHQIHHSQSWLRNVCLSHTNTTLQGSQRKLLNDEWASLRKFWKYQPLDAIRDYYGVKMGLYFAWLGELLLMIKLACSLFLHITFRFLHVYVDTAKYSWNCLFSVWTQVNITISEVFFCRF